MGFNENNSTFNAKFAETHIIPGKYVSVQSDWNEKNPEAPSYIHNKPDLSAVITDANYVHTDNNFTDRDKGTISCLVEDSETYSRNIFDLNVKVGDLEDEVPEKLDKGWTKLGEDIITEDDIDNSESGYVDTLRAYCDASIKDCSEIIFTMKCGVNAANSSLSADYNYSLYIVTELTETLYNGVNMLVNTQGFNAAGLHSNHINNVIVHSRFREGLHLYSLCSNILYNSNGYRTYPTISAPSYFYELTNNPTSKEGIPVNLKDNGRTIVLFKGIDFKFPVGSKLEVYGR